MPIDSELSITNRLRGSDLSFLPRKPYRGALRTESININQAPEYLALNHNSVSIVQSALAFVQAMREGGVPDEEVKQCFSIVEDGEKTYLSIQLAAVLKKAEVHNFLELSLRKLHEAQWDFRDLRRTFDLFSSIYKRIQNESKLKKKTLLIPLAEDNAASHKRWRRTQPNFGHELAGAEAEKILYAYVRKQRMLKIVHFLAAGAAGFGLSKLLDRIKSRQLQS